MITFVLCLPYSIPSCKLTSASFFRKIQALPQLLSSRLSSKLLFSSELGVALSSNVVETHRVR